MEAGYLLSVLCPGCGSDLHRSKNGIVSCVRCEYNRQGRATDVLGSPSEIDGIAKVTTNQKDLMWVGYDELCRGWIGHDEFFRAGKKRSTKLKIYDIIVIDRKECVQVHRFNGVIALGERAAMVHLGHQLTTEELEQVKLGEWEVFLNDIGEFTPLKE